MGLGDKFRELFGVGEDSLHPDGLAELKSATRATTTGTWSATSGSWRPPAPGASSSPTPGMDAVITSDHPLDEYGRGDIALRVPPGKWSEANELLDEPV